MSLLSLCQEFYEYVKADKQLTRPEMQLSKVELTQAAQCAQKMRSNYDYHDIQQCLRKVISVCPLSHSKPAFNELMYLASLDMLLSLLKFKVSGSTVTTEVLLPLHVTVKSDLTNISPLSDESLASLRSTAELTLGCDCRVSGLPVSLYRVRDAIEKPMFELDGLTVSGIPVVRALNKGTHLIGLPIEILDLVSAEDIESFDENRLHSIFSSMFDGDVEIQVTPIRSLFQMGTSYMKVMCEEFLNSLPEGKAEVVVTNRDVLEVIVNDESHVLDVQDEYKERLAYLAVSHCLDNQIEFKADFVSDIQEMMFAHIPEGVTWQ